MRSKTYVETESFNISFSPQHTYYAFNGNIMFSFHYSVNEKERTAYIPLSENELESFLLWINNAEKSSVEPVSFSDFSIKLLKKESEQIFVEFTINQTIMPEIAEITKESPSFTIPFSTEDFNLFKWDLVRTACECVLKKHNVNFTSNSRQGSECQEDFWNIKCTLQNPDFAFPVIYTVVLPYIGHYHSAGGEYDETVLYSLGGRHINLEAQQNSFCIEAYINETVNKAKLGAYLDFLLEWENKSLSFNVDSVNKTGFLWKIEDLSELTLDAIYKNFFEDPIAEIIPFYKELQSFDLTLFFSLESLDKYGFMSKLKEFATPFRIAEDYPDYRVFLRRKNAPPEAKPWILIQFSDEKISIGNNITIGCSTEIREFIQSPEAFTEFMDELKKLGWEI